MFLDLFLRPLEGLCGQAVKTFALRSEGCEIESGHSQICNLFPEMARINAGATDFVICAILSAGGVPFLRRQRPNHMWCNHVKPLTLDLLKKY
uniref:Uncharacterized protein n=1 Tax=Arion vulgaris TaxID=1028688 RepID=A0A0B7ASI2_9EUPU